VVGEFDTSRHLSVVDEAPRTEYVDVAVGRPVPRVNTIPLFLHGAHHVWLWSRSLTISGGSSEVMRNIIAKRRLRLPQG
jgi:alkylation response protein AidB-like acyl-CoA dehydrogenase